MALLNPLQINRNRLVEKGGQFASREHFQELCRPAGFQFEIDKPDCDFLQTMIVGVNEGIDFPLRPMEGVGYSVPGILDSFNFFEHDLLRCDAQAVDATLNAQEQVAGFDFVAGRDLLLVIRGTRILDLLMPARPGKEPSGGYESTLPGEIPAAQDEVD